MYQDRGIKMSNCDCSRCFNSNLFFGGRSITTYTPGIGQWSSSGKEANIVKTNPWSKHFRISKVRCHFPRANEAKRVKTHGWNVRMSTEGGRKVLMNRILKGRHVLAH